MVRVLSSICVHYKRKYLELKAKVADNELYTAKLMKEKEQWSQTKETSTKEVQFDYMIPSMGKSIILTECILYTIDR